MCGRYVTGTDEHDWRAWASLLELSSTALTEALAPSKAEVDAFYPTAAVPIVRRLERGIAVDRARWGLAPSWMKRPLSSPPQYNVRVETAPTKFKKYFATRRCLLPATGFWLAKDSGRAEAAAPFVRVIGAPTFAFAGLWTERELDGETLLSCTILTTEAGPELRALHERMPVVLTLDTAGPWLAQSTGVDELEALCGSHVEFEVAAAA